MKPILTFLLFTLSTANPTNNQPPQPISTTLLQTFTRQQKFAAAAICQPDKIATWTCKDRCDQTPKTKFLTAYSHNQTNSFAYLAYAPPDNALILAFRGTQHLSVRNWLADIDYGQVPLVGGDDENVLVHKGMQAIYQVHKKQILQDIGNYMLGYPVGLRLSATGHSLGAALVTLAAIDIQKAFPDLKVDVYAFGMPRIGNPNFAMLVESMFGERFYRIVHKTDLTTYVMPLKFKGFVKEFEFRHPANEYWINMEGKTVRCLNGGEDMRCSGSMRDYAGAANLSELVQKWVWTNRLWTDSLSHVEGYYDHSFKQGLC